MTNKDDSHVFFDYNADTITDYVTFRDNEFKVYEGNGANQPVNRITSITNGLGAVTDITYETLGHSDHYRHLDANFTDTTQQTCTVDLTNFIYGGGGALLNMIAPTPVMTSMSFYTALKWRLGSAQLALHSLGKQGNPVLELNGPMFVVTGVRKLSPCRPQQQPRARSTTAPPAPLAITTAKPKSKPWAAAC